MRPDPAYAADLAAARERTGLDESVITGEGRIGGHRVAVAATEFGFLGGSIGAGAGQRLTSAAERATAGRLPLITLPASGGTRMQEGTAAFLQMVKITAAVTAHQAAHLPYLVYLRHPTTGGVLASWAWLGHVTLAEPARYRVPRPPGVPGPAPRTVPRRRPDRREPARPRPHRRRGQHRQPRRADRRPAHRDHPRAPPRPAARDRRATAGPAAANGLAGTGGTSRAWREEPTGEHGGTREPRMALEYGGTEEHGGPGHGGTRQPGPAGEQGGTREPGLAQEYGGTEEPGRTGQPGEAPGTGETESHAGTAWTSALRTRQADYPGARDLIRAAATDVVALHETGLILAVARIGGYLRTRRAGPERAAPWPGGVRVAERAIRLADGLRLPLVTVIDTPGAELPRRPSRMAWPIRSPTAWPRCWPWGIPTISVLLGQGTGGAALALLPADRVIAAEHAWLAPLAPEGASAIVYRDVSHAAELAARQGIGARRPGRPPHRGSGDPGNTRRPKRPLHWARDRPAAHRGRPHGRGRTGTARSHAPAESAVWGAERASAARVTRIPQTWAPVLHGCR